MRSSCRRDGAALALASLAALAALAALSGCAGSDPQPLEPVALDAFGNQESLVAGGGAASTFGYTATPAGFPPTLRVARHDAASPDRIVVLGDVSFASGAPFTRLVVSDEAAAVVVGGGVRVVDLTDATLPLESFPALGSPDDLAVSGRWVLAAAGNDLVLVSRDAPLDTIPFTAQGAPTALLATQGRFLAFTATGYVAVDPSQAPPTFTEVNDPLLASVRGAFVDGTGALVAGPAAAPGRSRVARLDLTDPAAPAIVRSHELEGGFAAFAWDGGATLVVAVHGAGDAPDPRSFHEGWVVREGADGFSDFGVPLTFWSLSAEPLAAHAGRLLAAEPRGLVLLRIR